MSNTPTLNIIQYNVHHSREKCQLPFLHSLDPHIHHILAIQEPWISPHTHNTVKHPGYYEILADAPNPRTCFYVSKIILPETWTITEHHSDLITLQIQMRGQTLLIHNCYNPPSNPSSTDLGTLTLIPARLELDAEHVLLGDFNLHHPQWGGNTAQNQHKAADTLIKLTKQRQMHQFTPPGTITWETPRSCQTLDLAFGTQAIQDSLISCSIPENLATSSDHYPILTSLSQTQPETIQPKKRPQWKKADWQDITQKLEDGLAFIFSTPLDDPYQLDQCAQRIQETIQQCITDNIPTAIPSTFAKPQWSIACSTLTLAARRARRNWTQSHRIEDYEAYKAINQQKKRTIRKETNICWRQTVAEVTAHPQQVWKLARWARERAGKPTQLPQFPAIKDQAGNLQTTEAGKAATLAAHFFPEPTQADLRDIIDHVYPQELDLEQQATEQEILDILRKLPPDKAPGPDGIPNRLLKECRSGITPALAHFYTQCLRLSHHPQPLRTSKTVVLKKPQKPDYTSPKAYRPIALLNTLAKVLEAIVARKISKATEELGLLPENQMGARPKRSTTTALEYITEQIRTIWDQDKNLVASMLCLDISGAFDKVSHQRLIHNLRNKGFPQWLTQFINSFLTNRTTAISLGNFQDTQRHTATGIPQGSTLSPILFLFFASGLLPLLHEGPTSAVGFVDDTNILTFSKSTEENCRALEKAHDKCREWADKHGARFAPEKYQLIHFTRKRQKHNLRATVNIEGFTEGPVPDLRLLGIQIDTKLRWGPHVRKATEKAKSQMASLTTLTKSTWGATFHKAKHLYTAIVRPVLAYGSQIWHTPEGLPGHRTTLHHPLQKIQSTALRTVSGAYKTTPIPVLHHETQIPPLQHHLDKLTLTHARKNKDTPARQTTIRRCNEVALLIQDKNRKRRPIAPTRAQQLDKATQATKWKASFAVNGTWIPNRWQDEWEAQRAKKRTKTEAEGPTRTTRLPPAWDTGWDPWLHTLHRGLTRPQSTMATLLRTGHIGLNSYLYNRKVPGHESPACLCGFQKQDVKHILLLCPDYSRDRSQMIQAAGSANIEEILTTPRGIAAATKWMIQQGILAQFSTAREIDERQRGREKGSGGVY